MGFLRRLRRVFDVRDIAEGWKEGDEGGDSDVKEDGREGGHQDEDMGNIVSDCDEAQTKRRKHRIFMYVLIFHLSFFIPTVSSSGV